MADRQEIQAIELRIQIDALLESGLARAITGEDGQIRRLEPSEVGNSEEKRAIIEELNEFFLKHGLELQEQNEEKKKYRKRSELPDPDAPANAEVNRLREAFKVRVMPDLKKRVTDAAKTEGVSIQTWVERALEQALEK